MTDSVMNTPERRQMVLLAIAELSLRRPGWEETLREIAAETDGLRLFDGFRATSKDVIEPLAAETPEMSYDGLETMMREVASTALHDVLERFPHAVQRAIDSALVKLPQATPPAAPRSWDVPLWQSLERLVYALTSRPLAELSGYVDSARVTLGAAADGTADTPASPEIAAIVASLRAKGEWP